MIKKILKTLLLLTLFQLGFSQQINKEKLDNYFDNLELNNKFMGSVAISKNGKIIYTNSIGFSNVENNIKANKNSKYRIGSISKSFTTVLVLMAVEAKKLDLNQTIDRWFPTIKNAEKISIINLLNHRSGINDFTNKEDYLTWNTKPKNEKEMISIIAKGGSDFEPDLKAEYSNSNFLLLSYIIEKIYRKSYSEILQDHIIKPINLSDTYVFRKIDSSKNECNSYTYDGSWIREKETDYTIPLGAGAIASTPIDIVKFSDALFEGRLLEPESLKLMKTMKDGYGMGLFEMPFYSNIGYGHTGGIDAFSSVFVYFISDKISYALTSNGNNFNVNDISINVLNSIFNIEFNIPEFASYHLDSNDLNKYLGVYVSSQINMKITITKKDDMLIAQGAGQQPLKLEPIEKDRFKVDQVEAILEFDLLKQNMTLFQDGSKIEFTKEYKHE